MGVHLLPDTIGAGAENQARYLLAGLRDSGRIDVELAYFAPGRTHQQFAELGVPMRLIERRRRLRFDLLPRAARLRRQYKPRPPELLHTWLMEGNIVGLLAARRWPSTRIVITQSGAWNELGDRALVLLQRALQGRANHAISNSPDGVRALSQMGFPVEKATVPGGPAPTSQVSGTWSPERSTWLAVTLRQPW